MPGCRRGDHFTPPYDPWDQRLCLIPDGDLYRAVKAGTVEVVTDTVDTVTPTGITLTSGRELIAGCSTTCGRPARCSAPRGCVRRTST